MIEFFYHKNIQKEIATFEGRFPSLRQGIAIFERLCRAQFHQTKPQQAIAPGKLHRITENDMGTFWKTELIVPNSSLRTNQYPRMWFVVKGRHITCLCIATHMDKYNDEKMNKLALSRSIN